LPVLIAARAAAILAAIAVAPALARAQPDESVTRRAVALFEEARALSAKGDHAAACPIYEQSFALVPGLGTQLNLGDCWVRIGKLVAALDLFRDLEKRAAGAGQVERAKIARDNIQKLELRLPRVIVVLPPNVDGRVAIDKRDIELGATPIAVDPGGHRAELITTDGRTADATWIAVEGKTETIRLEPPPVLDDPPTDPDPSPAAMPVPPLIDDPVPAPRVSVRRRLALLVGAVGVGALGVSGALVIQGRRIKNNAIEDGCEIDGDDHATCPDQASADGMRKARRYIDAATIVGLSGLAVGAIAIVLYATAPEPAEPIITLVQPWIAPGGGGLAVERRW
jgi:hypothetical protein